MGKVHRTIVTHLEMCEPPRLAPAPKPPFRFALLRAVKPPLHFYRYIYDTIGRRYAWVSRRKLSDAALSAIIHDERVEIYVLYLDGAPAGFFEIDFRTAAVAELCFLGVMPEHIGIGLGRFMLGEAIAIAWSRTPGRMIVQTCTLDHPNALRLYQRAGFSPYAQSEAVFEE